MDQQKSSIIFENLNALSRSFELSNEFCNQIVAAEIFPQSYVDYIKRLENDSITQKKIFLVDVTRRESSSYRKLSRILHDLFDCDLLEDYAKDFYPINKKGYCLIINNENFETITPRHGSSKDVEKLYDTFSECLDFRVDVHTDMKRKNLLELLKQVCSDESLSNFDMFVLIIMSHGFSSHIICSDEEYISYSEIMMKFSNQNCTFMANKPKIIFFNCCRGPLPEDILKDNQNQDKTDSENTSQELKDIVEVYATLDNYLALRHEDYGTLFVDALTESLREYSSCELTKILIKANKSLMDKVKKAINNIERRQAMEFRFIGVSKSIYFRKSRE
ncbi:Protein spitz [Sarcoptes scabiei]|nr:Protein spitz [Sarcoptes scabiei]